MSYFEKRTVLGGVMVLAIIAATFAFQNCTPYEVQRLSDGASTAGDTTPTPTLPVPTLTPTPTDMPTATPTPTDMPTPTPTVALNEPQPCPSSGNGSGPSSTWKSLFKNDFPFVQYYEYCLDYSDTTSVSFKIDSNDEYGIFKEHNGVATLYGPVRWMMEFSLCENRFTSSSGSLCRDSGLSVGWVRKDLASEHPDKCALEPGVTYYLNIRVTTPQPNEYCTKSNGIEIGCGNPSRPGVCPMTPSSGGSSSN